MILSTYVSFTLHSFIDIFINISAFYNMEMGTDLDSEILTPNTADFNNELIMYIQYFWNIFQHKKVSDLQVRCPQLRFGHSKCVCCQSIE